jgi:hypothetical protein
MAKTLEIDLDDLVAAMTWDTNLVDSGSYLDRETGEIVFVPGDSDVTFDDVEADPRYLFVEPIDSHEGFRIMEDFIATLEPGRTVTALERALAGRKPFRAFKDALLDFPETRAAWFEFEHTAHRRVAEAWCDANDIKPKWRVKQPSKSGNG